MKSCAKEGTLSCSLQCWEGSEVAVLSEGVDDTWYCEELIVFKEVS